MAGEREDEVAVKRPNTDFAVEKGQWIRTKIESGSNALVRARRLIRAAWASKTGRVTAGSKTGSQFVS